MVQFNKALAALVAVSGATHVVGKGVRANERKLQSVCTDPGLDITMSDGLKDVLATIPMGEEIMEGLTQFANDGVTIGSSTALLPEANDAAATGAPIEDGMSGDTDFPHGNIKPLASVGERSVCPDSNGWKITGTPDGLGAYLADDNTVRVVVQSEGYGPLRIESFKFPVNGGNATFGGSHVQYVDYDREMLSMFMANEDAASTMVTGAGEMIETVINLKGEPVGPRNGESETKYGAHYSNTDANGTYAMLKYPAESDWFFQSLCSAHLEQKYQFGDGIGFEDDVFITNEEWSNFQLDKEFVGLSAHALDIQTKTLYALGVTTQGGFEKIVEINPQHSDYIMLGVSGYNGAFDISGHVPDTLLPQNIIDARNAEYGNRTDGNPYVYTNDIVPFRIYVGVKGKLEDGSDAPEDDFLARNGLKYGQMYGFAIDMRNETGAVGPTEGVWRDEWHKSAKNGDMVPGKWIPQEWRWDGTVKNFQHDGSWDYQNPPPGTEEGSDMEGYFWWNSKGIDSSGCKTEHLTTDPRAGYTAFIQGSTCGYMGHLYVNDVLETLEAAGGNLPAAFDGTYYVYQGETDITEQVQLGGAGQLPDGNNATFNWDNVDNGPKVTFEDIDGLEAFEAADGNLYLMIQEDSGNDYGERMFISSALEHDADDLDLTYYFVAQSGGKYNTRQMAGVSVPAGTACHDGEKWKADSHEFSGLFDMSGLLRKNEDGTFAMSAADTGAAKIANNAMVDINDKYILVGLQAGNLACGVIGAFQADRGGQWLVYQPNIPADGETAVERQEGPPEESEDELLAEETGDGM